MLRVLLIVACCASVWAYLPIRIESGSAYLKTNDLPLVHFSFAAHDYVIYDHPIRYQLRDRNSDMVYHVNMWTEGDQLKVAWFDHTEQLSGLSSAVGAMQTEVGSSGTVSASGSECAGEVCIDTMFTLKIIIRKDHFSDL